MVIGPDFSEAGFIQTIRAHAVSILVKRPLPKGSHVSVEFGAVTRAGQIASCRPKGGKYEVWFVIPSSGGQDLRAGERFPVSEQVHLYAAGYKSGLDALVVDVSLHGMAIETSEPLEKSEVITVESVSEIVFGVVHYSNKLDGGRYRVGIEVFHVEDKEHGQT